VKILHHGTKKTLRTYQPECKACGTVVEFREDDKLVEHIYDQRDGDYFMCACPVCHNTITIDIKLAVRE
jgi:hypothetical protein